MMLGRKSWAQAQSQGDHEFGHRFPATLASDTKLKPQHHIRPTVNLRSHVASALLLLAGLIPIVLVAWYVAAYGRPIPTYDQWWDTVYIAVKTKAGILNLEDILVRSGGHRSATIRVVAALSTILTDYDGGLLRFATFIITLLNLGLAILLLKRFGRLLPAFFFLSAATLFTLNSNSKSWLDM